MWEVIFYFIIVLPIGYKKYLTEENYNLSSKITNFMISFALFIFFASEFRRLIWELVDNGTSIFVMQSEIGIPHWYYISSSILYFLICFYCSALSINLGMKKEKTRKILINTIPVMSFILVSNSAILFMKANSSMIGKFFYSCFLASLMWLPILIVLYLLLKGRWMKELYM